MIIEICLIINDLLNIPLFILMHAQMDMMVCLPFVILAMILSKIVLSKKIGKKSLRFLML